MSETVQQLPKSGLASPRQHWSKEPDKVSADEPERVENMAFRPHRDDEFGNDQNDHGSVSLAGIIKLQPNRRKVNKGWRPMQASDLGESGSISGDGSFHFTDTEGFHEAIVKSDLQHPFIGFQSRLSVLSNATSVRNQLGNMYDGTNNAEDTAVFARTEDESSGEKEALPTAEATRVRLFGTLPDPIRLSEQMGKFDGQVIFIGHPNRDISAHQWSSSSFQWVNIGRYSYSRGKVEGSLASDRLRGIDEPHDTIGYFKLAAENRQALILENGRPKNHIATAGSALHAGVDVVGRTQVPKDPSTKSFRVTDHPQSETGSSFPSNAYTLLAKDALEDPFVAAASISLARSTNGNKFQGNVVNSTGSLDLTYRFPTKRTADIPSVTGSSTFGLKNTGSTSGLPSAPKLQEVAVGEEAATRRGFLLTPDERFQQLPSDTSHQPFCGHSQVRTKVEESRLTLPWYNDLASSTENPNSATRLAAPTRSVLSANCTTSSLSATAVPYSQAPTGHGTSGMSESSASTVNATGVGLHYSDPDGLRKTQQYEVANGLTQQAPTAQSFKGPFFTDSKPTTHDPTVSLSVHVSEEEKLINWFRDGHRPARQKEYTRSLIAAAVASDKNRHFGAIGEVCTKSKDGPYANTGPFVRLYENLSEYVEEHRNGGGQSYFTRRWKPAAPQLRELGPEHSRSYFGKGSARPSWPGAALLRPSDRMWG